MFVCVCASVRCGTRGRRFDYFEMCHSAAVCVCVRWEGGTHVRGEDVSVSIHICI